METSRFTEQNSKNKILPNYFSEVEIITISRIKKQNIK